MAKPETATKFISPSILIDYGKLLTFPTDFEQKYEGGIELLIKGNLILIAEIGKATLSPEGAYANGAYECTGYYYRIGGGYSKQFLPKNRIGISLRYGQSIFDENGEIGIQSSTGSQPDYTLTITRNNLKAFWWEVVLATDKKISELFSVGMNLKLKILMDYDSQSEVDVYAIPGYGRSFDQTIPAVNLFFKLTF